MKAIVLRECDDFDRLIWEDVDALSPGFGKIVIQNHAVGLNHCDTALRRGQFGVAQTLPHVMGVDSAGTFAVVIATTGAVAKIAAAPALGADEVVNYASSDVPNAVMRLTGGLGVDIAFKMVGGST